MHRAVTQIDASRYQSVFVSDIAKLAYRHPHIPEYKDRQQEEYDKLPEGHGVSHEALILRRHCADAFFIGRYCRKITQNHSRKGERFVPKRIISAVAATALALGGCGDKSEKSEAIMITEKSSAKDVVKLYLAEMGTIADTLEGVDSGQSAKQAAKELAAAAQKLEKAVYTLDEKKTNIGPMLIAANAREFTDVQIRLSKQIQRIATENPDWFEIISEELDKMPKIGEGE